jgi:polyisoprenoid-binding protein YceI
MKRIVIGLIALLVLSTGAFALQQYRPATGSLIRIEGTSTIHAWKMEGSTINGQLQVDENWNTTGKGSAAVNVAIPITTIKSEHSKMDKLMADALKAKTNPEIRYEMTNAALQSATTDSFLLKAAGKLTIAGVTRDVTMDVTGKRGADGQYVLTGEAPIRMTDFGIKPPTAMLNTIRTGDDVKVTFRWVVAATN